LEVAQLEAPSYWHCTDLQGAMEYPGAPSAQFPMCAVMLRSAMTKSLNGVLAALDEYLNGQLLSQGEVFESEFALDGVLRRHSRRIRLRATKHAFHGFAAHLAESKNGSDGDVQIEPGDWAEPRHPCG
jgi:hypothetical protein